MKFDALTDQGTRSALRLAWLEAALEPVSEAGRRQWSSLRPFRPGEEAQAQAQAAAIAHHAAVLDTQRVDAIRDALRSAPDALPAIARAGMGDVLGDAQFLEIARLLDVAQRIDSLLDVPGVGSRCTNEAALLVAHALERGRSGKFGFYLNESFDGALKSTRERAGAAQAEFDAARGRVAARVAQALQRPEVSGPEFIVMRDDLRGPLPPEVHVVREAPTYVLCALELDEAALDALQRRDAAAEAVANAERNVRAALSALLRSHARALEEVVDALGEVDILAARVRYAHHAKAVAPIYVTAASVACTEASFLPLRAELEREGRRYEPISFELSEVTVLTGPNMGGKSVALRTCGFLAVVAAFGLPVPAATARVALFEDIVWLGIGGDEEHGGLLSSFAREVVRLRDVLARPAGRVLLLVDEFARTTTPHEGRALLVALLDALRRRGKLAFIATHLAGIAEAARARHFAVRGLRNVPRGRIAGDLAEALAVLGNAMDYSVREVVDGEAGHADALALAHLLGLDDDIVANAGHVLLEQAQAQAPGESAGRWIP